MAISSLRLILSLPALGPEVIVLISTRVLYQEYSSVRCSDYEAVDDNCTILQVDEN